MPWIELIVLGLSVSVDAFAVSVSGALTDREHPHVHAVIAGGMFGVFQFIMPLLGGIIGSVAVNYIAKYDNYVAFLLLLFVGGKMIYEAIFGKEEKELKSPFDFPTIIVLAIATSLDALAVGLSLKLAGNGILIPAIFMGGITGMISFCGVMFGAFLGKLMRAERILTVIGGAAIILIGLKILLSSILK